VPVGELWRIQMSDRVLTIDPPGAYSPLYADFLSGRFEGFEPADGAFCDTSLWKGLAKAASAERSGTAEFWKEFAEHNARLGAGVKALRNAEALADGGCVAVMGGQQPSLLGGALLVLYKAATVVALSERVEEVTGEKCAPVFIVSGDDSDFAEVSGCTLFDAALRRLTAAFSQEGYRSGQMVGSLPVEEEHKIGGSLLSASGDPPGKPFVGDLISGAAAVGRDHGEFVAALISRLFSSHGLLVLEGRSRAMRASGRSLFESYLSRRDELALVVRAKGKELETRGYHAQLSGTGLDWWLFKIEDGLRKKSGEGGAAALERGLSEEPECVSPNVALRPLWRDSTFPAVLDVLGPSEVAYTIQLRDAYRMLGVSPRGMFPRLGLTLIPAEGVTVAAGWSEDAMARLLNDFDGTLAGHIGKLVPEAATEALEEGASGIAKCFAELVAALDKSSEKWGGGARSVARASEKGLRRLEGEIIDSLKRDAEKANPRLRGLGDFLRPGGKLQERTVSMLYPLLEIGEPFVGDVVDVARAHVNDCVEGRVRHYCYRIPGGNE
jgi:uncharacterized protein YllA (UPF0747 family)